MRVSASSSSRAKLPLSRRRPRNQNPNPNPNRNQKPKRNQRRSQVAKSDTDKLVEQLGGMTVLELVELKNKLEEEWGVTAAAPVAVAAPGLPAAGGGDGAAAEEKTEFD